MLEIVAQVYCWDKEKKIEKLKMLIQWRYHSQLHLQKVSY